MNTKTVQIHRHVARSLTKSREALAAISLVAALAIAGCQSGDSLAGPTWHWTAEQVANTATETVVADTVSYTIEFGTDGTVQVTADCNSFTGTYAVGIPLDLTIDLAPAGSTDCGNTSLGDEFLDQLNRVSSYSTSGGELKLFFADQTGGMRFAAVAS